MADLTVGAEDLKAPTKISTNNGGQIQIHLRKCKRPFRAGSSQQGKTFLAAVLHSRVTALYL